MRIASWRSGLDVIAQPLDRGVEELDRQHEQQTADEGDPSPKIAGDEEGERQEQAGDRRLLLDRRFGAETFLEPAERVPEGSADAGEPAAARQGRLGARQAVLDGL